VRGVRLPTRPGSGGHGHLAGELAAAVTAQVERIVLSVLRWTNGALRREPMDRPLPADLALDLNTHRLLLLGTRLFPDPERLDRALGPPGRRLRRVTPWPFDYDQAPTSPAERAALALGTRSVTLGELMSLPHPRPQLVRGVYALLVGGLLEDAPARGPAPALGPSPEAVRAAIPQPRPAGGGQRRLLPDAEDAGARGRGFLEKRLRQRAIEVRRRPPVPRGARPGGSSR
jgi:hypothetical protein